MTCRSSLAWAFPATAIGRSRTQTRWSPPDCETLHHFGWNRLGALDFDASMMSGVNTPSKSAAKPWIIEHWLPCETTNAPFCPSQSENRQCLVSGVNQRFLYSSFGRARASPETGNSFHGSDDTDTWSVARFGRQKNLLIWGTFRRRRPRPRA